MVRWEIILNESLIVLGENGQIYTEKLVVVGTLEENGAVFEVFNDSTIYRLP